MCFYARVHKIHAHIHKLHAHGDVGAPAATDLQTPHSVSSTRSTGACTIGFIFSGARSLWQLTHIAGGQQFINRYEVHV